MEFNQLGRREFIAKAAGTAAGLALGVSTVDNWAHAQVSTPIELKLRQDLIYDELFDMILRSFNTKIKDLSVKSSYIDSDKGWGYERDHALEVPSWYTEGEECDVFMARGPAIAQLADEGLIAPLDDMLKSSSRLQRDDFHKSAYGSILDSATYRGTLWGIPIIGNTYALFCNNDLFKAAGVTSYPTTWEEAIESAEIMTRDLDGDGAPDVFGYSQCSFQYPLQIVASGLDFVDLENKKVHYDSDLGVEALAMYRDLHRFSPPHTDFQKNDMAMKVSVTTNAFGKYSHLDYTTVPLPAGNRPANTYGDSDGITALCISSKISPERQEAAWTLIEFMLSQYMFFKMVDYSRMLPVRHSILEGEKYAKYLKKNPVMNAFVEGMKWAVPKPCIPEYRFLEVVMREILYPVQMEGGNDITNDEIREHLIVQAARANEVLAKSKW